MRLYNSKSATPLASSGAKRSQPVSFLPKSSASNLSWISVPHSPRQSENESAFQSSPRHQGDTYGTNSPKICEKSTASTASSESFDGLIGRFSSESFHFDIDIVKKGNEKPSVDHSRDDFSSSSTLTSVSKEVAIPFSPFDRTPWPPESQALPAPCKVQRRRLSSAGADDPFWNSDVRPYAPSSSRNLYSLFRGASAQSRSSVACFNSNFGLFPTQQRADSQLPESRDDDGFGATRFPSVSMRDPRPATPPFSAGKGLSNDGFEREGSDIASWIDFSGDCTKDLFSGYGRASQTPSDPFAPIERPPEPPQKAFHLASPAASRQKPESSPADVSSPVGKAIDCFDQNTDKAPSGGAANVCIFNERSARIPTPIDALVPQQSQKSNGAPADTHVKSGPAPSADQTAKFCHVVSEPIREDFVSPKANKANSSQRRVPVLLGHLLEKRYQSELKKRDSHGHNATDLSREHMQPKDTMKKAEPLVSLVSIPDKYAKMLKVGLPLPAVRQAMERDGVDPRVLDGKAPSKTSLPGKYSKMLKVGLPVAAVKQAMQRDGVDPSVLEDVASTDAQMSLPSRDAVPKDPYRRFRLHWETHGNIRSNTLWAMLKRDQPWLAEVKVDEEELASLFQAERNPTLASDPTKKKDIEKSVRVIDPKRANNGGIILARIKLSHRDIARAINSYDETELTLEQIRGIIPLVPTKEEKQALQHHIDSGGQPLRSECEKFMIEIMAVPDAKGKLEAMLFVKKFPICVDEIKNGKICSLSVRASL